MLNKRKLISSTGVPEVVIPVRLLVFTQLRKRRDNYDFGGLESLPEDAHTAVHASSSVAHLPAGGDLSGAASTKILSMKKLTESSEARKEEIMFKKVDAKAQTHLEKFRNSTPLSIQLPESERVRQRIRENFFYGLVFGLEELKFRQAAGMAQDTRDYVVEVNKFLLKDEKTQLEQIKNITLPIEANLYHNHNKDVSKNSGYSNKARLVGIHDS